ncbi:tripeptidyl peptidase A [Artomyces pyxidatus]|uniref:Tripeptidyl peptidase A n=1 Tax=Artomyces pyxidatus TaxID=48021 RepID=A0ACB8STA0_9AGAM|nr:tripeptidyl peptidase A [Artomyces pyxidatus]
MWPLLLPFALAGSAYSTILHAHTLVESIVSPDGWVNLGAAPAGHIIPLRIALPQANFSALEEHLYAVSDPAHKRYGAHLSKAEVEALVAPHPDSVSAVDTWLSEHGIPNSACTRSPAGDWVSVRVPVALAESMLNTTFYKWKHVEDDVELVRTTKYSLPEHLHAHIELVQPTTLFGRKKGQPAMVRSVGAPQTRAHALRSRGTITVTRSDGSTLTVDASCNVTVTIACLRQLLNIGDYRASGTNGNRIAVAGYLEEYANYEDQQIFYKDQLPEAVNSSFTYTLVNGGRNDQNFSSDTYQDNTNMQTVLGLVFPATGTYYSTGGRGPWIEDSDTDADTVPPYGAWLDFVLAQETLPQTIMTAYQSDEQTIPESYAKRVCAGFAQLGARGISLLVMSGNGGVGDANPDPRTQRCWTNDGRHKKRFLPAFPASCPFVTTVGATMHIPEVPTDVSGGGFSEYWSRPSYQDDVVSEYLTRQLRGTYAGLYNPNGRAIPDVSAQAYNFRIAEWGHLGMHGGGQESTAAFAGLVSLLNDARIEGGKPPLGFLNPFLYSAGTAAFNDITSGNAPGCGTQGFNATVGWDPITGLGTPDFGKLKDLALAL